MARRWAHGLLLLLLLFVSHAPQLIAAQKDNDLAVWPDTRVCGCVVSRLMLDGINRVNGPDIMAPVCPAGHPGPCTATPHLNRRLEDLSQRHVYFDVLQASPACAQKKGGSQSSLRRFVAAILAGRFGFDDVSTVPRFPTTTWHARGQAVAIHAHAWHVEEDAVSAHDHWTWGTVHESADGRLDGPHLTNTYTVVIDGAPTVLLRMGCLFSDMRAREFVAWVQHIREVQSSPLGAGHRDSPLIGRGFGVQRANRPARLLSLSLMRTTSIPDGHERSMLEKHHAHFVPGGYVHDTLHGDVEVAHVNLQSNAAISLKGLIQKGDGGSREMNARGYHTLLRWLLADMDFMWDFAPMRQLGHRSPYRILFYALLQDKGVENSVFQWSAWWDRHHVANHLQAMANSLQLVANPQWRALATAARALSLLHMPKARLPNVPKRDHEYYLLALVTRTLRVVPVVNCKSGIDRTGFVSAIFAAYHAVEHTQADFQLQDLVADPSFGPSLVAHTLQAQRHAIPAPHDVRAVLFTELLNAFTQNMFQIAYKIVFFSTGLLGLKYGTSPSSIDYNPVPGYNFPPYLVIPPSNSDDDIMAVSHEIAQGLLHECSQGVHAAAAVNEPEEEAKNYDAFHPPLNSEPRADAIYRHRPILSASELYDGDIDDDVRSLADEPEAEAEVVVVEEEEEEEEVKEVKEVKDVVGDVQLVPDGTVIPIISSGRPGIMTNTFFYLLTDSSAFNRGD